MISRRRRRRRRKACSPATGYWNLATGGRQPKARIGNFPKGGCQNSGILGIRAARFVVPVPYVPTCLLAFVPEFALGQTRKSVPNGGVFGTRFGTTGTIRHQARFYQPMPPDPYQTSGPHARANA